MKIQIDKFKKDELAFCCFPRSKYVWSFHELKINKDSYKVQDFPREKRPTIMKFVENLQKV